MQNAFNKYGYQSFKVGVLQLCNLEDTLFFEQQWLSKAFLNKDKYYNAAFISKGNTYVKEETRKKLSASHKGKVYSEEYKTNISKSQRGKFRKDNPTGFTGVTKQSNSKKYLMQIRRYGKDWTLYGYKTPEEASEDYQHGLTLSDKELTEWVEHKRKLLKKKQSSKYTGVSFDKTKSRWNAYVDKNGKRKTLGYHKTEEEAYKARINYLSQAVISSCLFN